jgi:hypothetical protein
MTIRAQIAFDLSLTSGVNFFTLDDVDKGVLDNTSYVLGGDVLADVSQYVRGISVKRGRSRILEKFTAGNANLSLDNRNRYFDPTYGPTIGGTRTNLVTNPSFEVDTAGWTARGTITASSDFSVYGAKSLKHVSSATLQTTYVRTSTTSRIAVTEGSTYSLSIYVRAGDANTASHPFRCSIYWYDASGSIILISSGASESISVGGGWVALQVVGTAPATAVSCFLQAASSTAMSSQTFYYDGALFEESSTVGAYFDGTTADPSISVNSQTWNGTANASTSTLVWNSDPGSPYFGSILPRKQLVIDEDGEEIFTGFVEDWNFSYPQSGFDAIAEVSASDGFSILAQQTLSAGTATAQLSGARVTAELDAVGWSAVKRDIGVGQSTLDADVIPANTNVLQYLQKVETSEFGALFIDRAGAVAFRDRAELQAFTTGVTFSSSGIPYRDIAVVWGTEEMKNSVSITYTSGGSVAGTAVADDTAAQTAYGIMDASYETILSSPVEASSLASWLVGLYAHPQYRVDSLTVRLQAISEANKASVLDLELGDVVRVEFTPSNIGSVVSQIVSIDQISHEISVDTHDVTFTLSQALAAFILDDALFGVLDEDILGF